MDTHAVGASRSSALTAAPLLCAAAAAISRTRVNRKLRRIAPSGRRRSSACVSVAGRAFSTHSPAWPPRMHRWTHFRLVAKAIKAQECALGLEIEDIHRRFPRLLPPRAAARRASRDDKFFTPRALAAEN